MSEFAKLVTIVRVPICGLETDNMPSEFRSVDDGPEEMGRSSWAIGEIDMPVQQRFGDGAKPFAGQDI